MVKHRSISRRDLLISLPLSAALARVASGQKSVTRARPLVIDSLCLSVINDLKLLTESGIDVLVTDLSAWERLPTTDGSVQYRRGIAATLRNLVTARRALRDSDSAFLWTGAAEKNKLKRGKTAIIFQVQGGGEIVETELDRIDLLAELGLRVFQMTHHGDNPLAGGCLVKKPSGLTKHGREAVERLNSLGVVPDLSHASDQTSLDTAKASKGPVIISHTGARSVFAHARCAPDDVIRAVADSGGVVGIFSVSFFLTSEPTATIDSYLRHIKHVIKIAGIDAVGIGNDLTLRGDVELNKANGDQAKALAASEMDQWWQQYADQDILGFRDNFPRHVAILELNNIKRIETIRGGLKAGGYTSSQIDKIMGGNWARVLMDV